MRGEPIRIWTLLLALTVGLASPVAAQEADDVPGAAEAGAAVQDVGEQASTDAPGAEPDTADEERATTFWSTTLIADFPSISDPWRNDDLTDFFDQYEWTPNKGSSLPVELGIRDASFDYMARGDTPVWQLRFRSPSSNLGVSGSQIDDPFLNQRADLLGRLDGVQMDLDYRRFRTSDLRIFPETLGRPYLDLTNPTDRFTHDRTGIAGEIRLRPSELAGDGGGLLARALDPELSFRGDYQSRPGLDQRRFLLQPANTWIGLAQPQDESASTVGGGVLVVPGGAFTLDLDVDYHRFDSDPTVLQGVLSPVPPPTRTVGFVPDSERLAGQARVHGRIADRATLEGGFQIARLQQVGDLTPAQVAAGLRENEVLALSANAALDVPLGDRFAVQGRVKYDQRTNDLDRTSTLFSPANGTQVDEFLRRYSRLGAELEAVHRPWRRQVVAVGARFDAVDRTLFFADATSGFRAILPANALVDDDTRSWTVYGRTQLRAFRSLQLQAEVGYRGAPETGYIVDLDDYVYGRARATWTIQTARPIQLSAFVQGGTGENHDFTMVDGIGPLPSGTLTPRDFERSDYQLGLSASFSPHADWSLFASVTHGSDSQDQALVLSNLQRYFQPLQPITFAANGVPDWSNEQTTALLGAHVRIDTATDVSASYSFTRIDASYAVAVPSNAVALIEATSAVRSDIHGVHFEAGHWLRDGLRVLAGYRMQHLGDGSPLSSGQGSVISPLPLSVTHHTVTVGVTLTEALFSRAN